MTLSIDGPGVYESYEGPSGSADVPFSCGEPRHTYLLTTTGGEGAVASEEIVVRRARPEVLNFSANTLVLNGPCTQVHQRRLFWTVDHAIGVRISSGGQVLGEYNSREGSELFPYDCRNSPTVTYTIETTGAYGPHATQTIEVGYQAPV